MTVDVIGDEFVVHSISKMTTAGLDGKWSGGSRRSLNSALCRRMTTFFTIAASACSP
ncbi:MAG: hypothetical protein R3F11_28465 [Verrucomicrobiales bacterium]